MPSNLIEACFRKVGLAKTGLPLCLYGPFAKHVRNVYICFFFTSSIKHFIPIVFLPDTGLVWIQLWWVTTVRVFFFLFIPVIQNPNVFLTQCPVLWCLIPLLLHSHYTAHSSQHFCGPFRWWSTNAWHLRRNQHVGSVVLLCCLWSYSWQDAGWRQTSAGFLWLPE